MKRASELIWILDHLDDLESDFSAIHRVDNMYELAGPRFFKRASRMYAYHGMMRLIVENEQIDNQETDPTESSPGETMSLNRDIVNGETPEISKINNLPRATGQKTDLIEYKRL